MKDVLVLLLFGFLARADAGHYFVLGPNPMRFQHDETVLVSVFGETNFAVKVWLEHNGNKISETDVVVPNEREPVTITMRVNEGDIFNKDTKEKPRTILLVASDRSNVRKEVELVLSYNVGYLIVQTDKPIYTPQQEVRVRTLTMDESLMSANTWNVSMDIISPSNLTMGRIRRKNKDTFFTHLFTLPPHPEHGTWTILAKYSGQLETKSRALFKVQEYVLPTFGVEIDVDAAYILQDTREIKVNVKAKYVYGKPVQGKVGLSLFLRNREDGSRDAVMNMKRERLSFEGTFEFIVPVADIINSPLRDRRDFPNGCHLEIVADVLESATGNEEFTSHERTVFAIEPYTFKFTRSKRNFRPGWEYYLKVDMFLANGDVAKGKDIEVNLLANNKVTETQKTKTDANGQAVLHFSTGQGHEIQFEAIAEIVISERYTVKPYKGENQMQVEQVMDEGNVVIRAFTNQQLGVGRYSGLLFVVVTRGKIVFTKYEEPTNMKSNPLSKDLQEEITPSARLLVFYIDKNTNQLVADAIKFDVEAKCRGEGLTLTTNKDTVKPGETGQLTITGSPLMHVGLNVMDKALLLLNRENVMRRSKMFRELENHDRGCGEGSGESVEEVFRNTGLTVISNAAINFDKLKRNSEECDEKRRRKRSIDCSANEMCCDQGAAYAEVLLDEHGEALDAETLCYARAKWMADGGKVPVKCLVAFYRKCINTIADFLAGARAGSRSDVSESDYEIDIQSLEGMDPKVRSNFRESWLFEQVQLDDNGVLVKQMPFPDSITEWMVQAIGITKSHGMCIAEPKNVTAFRDFFIQLELPYKAVRLEQIDVKATIFSYGNMETQASIYLKGRSDVCSNTRPGQHSPRTRIALPPNSAQTVTFPIVPLKNGHYDIEVSAIVTNLGIATADAIQKPLYVVYEGVEKQKSIYLCLDPLKQMEDCQDSDEVVSEWPGIDVPKQVLTLNLGIPIESIPDTGSATAYITSNIMDDVVTTLINGADKLLRQPRGCGEQTMIYLAPTVYAMSYLKETNNVNDAIEQMGNKYIREGVNRELTYRHPDGSYAAWLSRPSSTWLTAFVAKVFCQAKNIVDDAVDEAQHIVQTVNWLTTKQKEDGSFVDSQPVIHREMIGQLTEGDPSLTAFVLISMSECRSRTPDLEDSMNKAMRYIENLNRDMLRNNPYLLAISTYALGLTKSGKGYEFKTLLNEIKKTEGKNIYWGIPGGVPANAQSIETTSYALLATMLFDDFKTSAYVVRWLTSQRNAEGSFRTTQDTVIGLQALSQYSIRTYSRDVNLKVQTLAKNWAQSGDTVAITNENSQLQKIIKNLPMTTLTVEVTGTGTGRMVIDLRYNIPSKPDEICPFLMSEVEIGEVNEHIDVNLFPEKNCDICGNCEGDPEDEDYIEDNFVPLEAEPKANSNFGRKRRQAAKRRGERATKSKKCMKFNVRSKSNKKHGMSIVHVGLETGMKVVEDDLKKLEEENIISRYEMPENEKGFIIFYVDEIGPAPIPFIFRLIDDFEGDINTRKSATVKVYDYYYPDQQCKTFYGTGPNKGQPVEYECNDSKLKKGCQCAQTICAQPWKHNLMKRATLPPVIRLFNHMCDPDKANYGIRVLINSVEPDVVKEINTASATVEKVFNRGIEKLEPESELDFFWKMNCPHPLLEVGKVYYIFARDGNMFKDEDGNTIYRYPLMDTAIILEKPPNKGERKYEMIMTNFEKMMRKKQCSQ